jgi:hypothetical protein
LVTFPEHACWPGFVEIIAPSPGFAKAVVEQLGWNWRNRDARIIVGSTLQTFMVDARRRPEPDPEEGRRLFGETRQALTEAGYYPPRPCPALAAPARPSPRGDGRA